MMIGVKWEMRKDIEMEIAIFVPAEAGSVVR